MPSLVTDSELLANSNHSCPSGSGLSIGAGEIHVWSAWLERPQEVSASLAKVLSPDEIIRAGRFRFERDANRYVIGRALLRGLLGSYVGLRPESLRFSYSRYGKPALAEGSSRLAFNLSHSDDLAIYAFCLGSEVGVDLERERREPAGESVPERFFSQSEVATLRALPIELQTRAFLSCWTRKEAFLKARGDGLSLALDQFDVSLAPNHPPALLRTAWAPGDALEWTLYDLSPKLCGYVAALAVRPGDWMIRMWPRLNANVDTLREFGAGSTIATEESDKTAGPTD